MNVQLKLRQCFKNGIPDSEITEIIQNSIPKQIKNLQEITSSIILGISTFATIITIIFIFAVIKAIKNQKVSRKYYIFILNRSIGDFFTSLLFVILSILRLILHNPTQIQKTVLQIIWYIINASLWSEMISYHLLSGIKLYAVAKPIHYRQKFKRKYCIYLASLSWIVFLILLLLNSIIYVIRINNKEYYHTNIYLDVGGTIHGKIQDIISTTIYLITLIFFILTVILVFRAQKFQNKSRKKPNFPFSRFAITFTVFILFYSLLIFADIYFSFIYPKTSFCFQIHSQVTAITVTEIIWILGLIRISIDPIINCFTDKEIIQFFTIFLAQWIASSFMVMLPYVSIGPLPTTLLSNSAGLINAQANATLLLLFNRNLRNIAKGSIAQVQSIRIIQTKVTPFSGMHQRSTFK